MLTTHVFIYSFIAYSLLRYFDVWSTKLCLAKLDPEIHEANPIVAPLLKKIGFDKTMLLTWLLFAIPIGLADALYVDPVTTFPILWLFFGLFHVMAAANNLQIHFQMKIFGAEIVKENTMRIIKILKGLSFSGKVAFLVKTNFLNVFFALYAVATLTFLSILLTAIDITIKRPIPVLLAIGPPIMILDLIMFFPAIVFGSLMISLRRLRIANRKNLHLGRDQKYLTVSVECLEKALREAQANGADCVQFLAPPDMHLSSASSMLEKGKAGEGNGP